MHGGFRDDRVYESVDGLYFRAATGAKIELLEKGWYKVDGAKIKIDGADATIRNVTGGQELIVPVRFKDGKATFMVETAW